MKKKYIIIGIIILIIIAIINNKNNKEELKNNVLQLKSEILETGKIQVISHKIDSWHIEVVFKNNTGKKIEMVTLEAECYDEKGNNLGIAKKYETNINTTDNYKSSIFCDKDTAYYKLSIKYKE